MASDPLSSNEEHPSPVPPEILQFLEDWVARVPLDLAEAARYAALPHSFDASLISFLRAPPADTEDTEKDTEKDTKALLARLQREGLISTVRPGCYAFEPLLRGAYLRLWQADDLPAYRRASERAAEYFEPRQAASDADRTEYVYHLLGADDEDSGTGISALAAAFEDARSARRLGLAERLLLYAQEQAPVLGTDGRAWLQLFQARLELAHYRYDRSEDALRALLTTKLKSHVRAEALMSLANTLVATQRWTEALESYDEARQLFLQLDDRLETARVLQSQGMAYLHLVSSLGGLRENVRIAEPRYQTWWRRIAYAPFLSYLWFSRRVSRVPNLYYGSDYQDWVIYRILYRAISCFEQASHQLATVPKDAAQKAHPVRVDVQIHLADLYHRVGRWNQAEHLFRDLATAPPVKASDYRRATLQLAQGRAALARSSGSEARKHLGNAREVFGRYEDYRALATAARLLGDAEVGAGNPDGAVPFYAESAAASLAVDDLLASTHIWSRLRSMRGGFTFSPAVESQVDALEQRLDGRAYVIRFRGALLQHFRKLATRVASYGILPLTYLVMSLLHATPLKWVLFALIYNLTCLFVPNCNTWIGDLVGSVLLVLATLLPAIWTYGFLYMVVGWMFVRRLDMGEIARLQAEFVVTLPEGCTLRDEQGELSELPWAVVESHVSANRAIWRVPLQLFSRQFLVSTMPPMVIDGITRHYQSLQADIKGRLAQAKKASAGRALDYSLLRSPWSLVALLLVMVLTVVSVSDRLDTTCREPNIVSLWLREQSRAYVSAGDGRLHAVDVWDWRSQDLSELGSIILPGEALDIKLFGGHAYVAAKDKGLRIVDISDPTTLSEVGGYDTPGQASGVAVALHYAYIADGSDGLRIVDIRDPTAPVEVGFYDTPGQAFDVVVVRRLVYVADGSSGLRVVNVQDPAAPVEVGYFDTPGQASGVAVAGSHLFIADGTAGVRVVRIKDPTAPTEVGFADTPGEASRIAVAGSSIFIADGSAGLHVLRVEDPTAPTKPRQPNIDTPGQATGVALALGLAFVADGSGGLRMIDVANPCDKVEELRTFDVPGSAMDVAAPEAIYRPIASVSFEFIFWALLIFPVIGLGRLLYNRAILRRIVGSGPVSRADWPLWLAVILLIGLAAFHIWTLTR